MKEKLETVFERFGLAVRVTQGETVRETHAFVQPMTRESGEEPFTATPVGAADGHVWRYLGPAEVELRMGDRLTCRSGSYVVRDTAAMYLGEEALYRWAMLAPEEKA